ncbi:hypothetical protein M422DRAFT_173287, partial [Sphaerobolus stellatus SS14]
LQLPHSIPTPIAGLKAQHKAEVNKRWLFIWQESKHAHKMRAFNKWPPSKRVLRFYKSVPRRSCNTITQLRIGFIGLNSYLHKINAVDSPKCSHC